MLGDGCGEMVGMGDVGCVRGCFWDGVESGVTHLHTLRSCWSGHFLEKSAR